MWKFWLAAGVVAVATFGVVTMVGLQAVDDDEPAQAARKTSPAPALRSWADRANKLCVTGIRDVRNVVARQPVGDETDQQRQLRFFLETTRIEGELVAGLRKLPVKADRAKVEEAIDRFEQEYKRDVLLGNALRRKFDLKALRSRITQYEREAARLRTLFGSVGADSCAAYFDPTSYG